MMTRKTAIAGAPYGGAKGGVNVDVNEHTSDELQRIARGFMDKISKVLGPTRDIPAPDEDEVNAKLGRILRSAYHEVDARAEREKQTLRTAAFEIAIERVVDASRTRGYFD